MSYNKQKNIEEAVSNIMNNEAVDTKKIDSIRRKSEQENSKIQSQIDKMNDQINKMKDQLKANTKKAEQMITQEIWRQQERILKSSKRKKKMYNSKNYNDQKSIENAVNKIMTGGGKMKTPVK